MAFRLLVKIEGMPTGGGSYELNPAGTTVIGRKAPADVVIGLPEVSSKHAALLFDPAGGQFFIEDLNSKQGTYVNAEKLEPGQRRALAAGETVQLGRAFFKIEETGGDGAGGEADTDMATMLPEATILAGADEDEDEAGKTILEGLDDEPETDLGEATNVGNTLLEPAAPAGPEAPAASTGAGRVSYSRDVQEVLLKRVDLSRIVKQAASDDHARQVVREQIGYVVNELFSKGRIRKEQVEQVEKEAFDDILGFGPIQDLIDRTDISEIMVNRPDQIYYEQKGKLKVADRSFMSDLHVQQILRRLLRNSQRRIDESNPTVNAMLPDGSRLHAVVPPIALDGTKITIRKFGSNLSVDQLVKYGSMTPSMATFLELATRERQNIVVSGGTGSGKTTLLNVLSSFIPEDQRVVTIEDTAELSLGQPHVVRLQARPSNTEGVGLVSIQQLVVEALRMRPDRIVVGECRHAEALDMLQAMNTGHDGSLTTVHSNSAADALHRLETMVLLSGLDLPIRAIREQIRSAVNLIVHADRLVDGSRRVKEIIEITGMEEGNILYQPVYRFEETGMQEDGTIVGSHTPTGYIPRFLNIMRQQGKDIPADLFAV